MNEISPSTQQLVVFRLQEGRYGVPLENVHEVLHMLAIQAVPNAPDWLPGVINVRGQVTPLVDLRLRFRLPPLSYSLATPIVLVQVRRRLVGLIVDQMEELIQVLPEGLTPPDELFVKTRPIQQIARQGEWLVYVLDLPRVTAGTQKFTAAVKAREKHALSRP